MLLQLLGAAVTISLLTLYVGGMLYWSGRLAWWLWCEL